MSKDLCMSLSFFSLNLKGLLIPNTVSEVPDHQTLHLAPTASLVFCLVRGLIELVLLSKQA
jgi:hypothetical protein